MSYLSMLWPDVTLHQHLTARAKKASEKLSTNMLDIWAEEKKVGLAAINCFVMMYIGKQDGTVTALR